MWNVCPLDVFAANKRHELIAACRSFESSWQSPFPITIRFLISHCCDESDLLWQPGI